jgi:hypothetical protein
MTEALPGGKTPAVVARRVASRRAANGLRTVVEEQLVGNTRYFDAAGFPGRTVGLDPSDAQAAQRGLQRDFATAPSRR